MASLREIRRKIKSIKSTLSVTKAMKMVSAARLAKAQSRILSARPFALRMREFVEDIDSQYEENRDISCRINSFLCGNKSSKELLIVVSADKGLCGAFNGNAIRAALSYMDENKDKEFEIIVVGKKARDYFKRYGYQVEKEYVNVFHRLGFVHAEMIGNDIMDLYSKDGLGGVRVIYNSYKNALVQQINNEPLLPVEFGPEYKKRNFSGFLYEPSLDKILESLMPRYLKAQIFRILLDSFAAEMSARMSAMESATKNALELIDFMNLKFNKVRQELITRDLTELVGGAEALNW